jgi:hypothetical protein
MLSKADWRIHAEKAAPNRRTKALRAKFGSLLRVLRLIPRPQKSKNNVDTFDRIPLKGQSTSGDVARLKQGKEKAALGRSTCPPQGAN